LTADIDNTGMPAPSGDQTFAVLTLGLNDSSDIPWIPQVAILNTEYNGYSGYYFYALLLSDTGVLDMSFNGGTGEYLNQVSGLANSWHTIAIGTTSLVVGSTNYEYLEWYLDGTAYVSWQFATCTTPCSFSSSQYYVNDWIVPSSNVETDDYTNSDFSSLNVHGYFEEGTTTLGNIYLYPALWGACTGSGNGCSGVGGDCPLPSGAQKDAKNYVGNYNEGPANGAVTGYLYSGYGATHEWGIGPLGYTDITDSDLSSSFCSSGPPQIA
jgi:hypothetical protein